MPEQNVKDDPRTPIFELLEKAFVAAEYADVIIYGPGAGGPSRIVLNTLVLVHREKVDADAMHQDNDAEVRDGHFC